MKGTVVGLLSRIRKGQGVELPRGEIISPSGYQFYVDWSRLNSQFENSMKGLHVYCKGAVHEGKSSFAKSYAEDPKNNACFLPCNELDHLDHSQMRAKVFARLQQRWPGMQDLDDVLALPQNHTILFDECHLLFKWMDEHLGQLFVKRTSLPCRVAFLSTTQVGLTASGIITPAQVTNKVVLPWRFNKEEVRDLIPSMITKQFDGTTIYRRDDVVDTLFSLFCGHRGMTVMALDYIADCMKNDNLPISEFSLAVCRRYLCEMLRMNKGAMKSRAISISGGEGSSFPYSQDYNDNIRSLVEMAVSMGEVPAKVASKVPHDIARCVTLGALVPKDMWVSPTRAVDIGPTTAYCVPNPFLLRNLAATIGLDKKRITPKATRPVEVILTGISHLSYDALFSVGGTTTLASKVLFEDPLNDAIKDGINLAYKPKRSVSVFSSKKVGKPDIIFDDFVIEGVVYNNDVKGHYKRFWERDEYKVGQKDHRGLLLVYCSSDELVAATKVIKDIVEVEVPILLVAISFASLWSFETHFIQKQRSTTTIATTVKTDLSVYTFDKARGEFLPSQQLPPVLEKTIAVLKPIPVSVWVKAKSGGSAFKVTPATNDIDSLKKAIKAELPKSVAEELMSAQLTIIDPNGNEVTKQSASLDDTTEDKPYSYKLPEKP